MIKKILLLIVLFCQSYNQELPFNENQIFEAVEMCTNQMIEKNRQFISDKKIVIKNYWLENEILQLTIHLMNKDFDESQDSEKQQHETLNLLCQLKNNTLQRIFYWPILNQESLNLNGVWINDQQNKIIIKSINEQNYNVYQNNLIQQAVLQDNQFKLQNYTGQVTPNGQKIIFQDNTLKRLIDLNNTQWQLVNQQNMTYNLIQNEQKIIIQDQDKKFEGEIIQNIIKVKLNDKIIFAVLSQDGQYLQWNNIFQLWKLI